MKLFISILWLALGCSQTSKGGDSAADDTKLAVTVLRTCHDIISASYEDSVKAAEKLQSSVQEFLKSPSEAALAQARQSWIKARQPYLQTETYRFCGGPIDTADGPEERLNAWPIDESVIDVVPHSAVQSIIADSETYPVLSAALLKEMNMKEGEKNITCGWHAIEFLLWGQDTQKDGPGQRPWTDFTTAPHAKRRGQYLATACALLVEEMRPLAMAWDAKIPGNHRAAMVALEPDMGLRNVVKGMLMLSGFELATERILVACETHSQEEEQSCFSDTTNQDLQFNILGMRNLWDGNYRRTDGSVVRGASLEEMTRGRDPELADELTRLLKEAETAAAHLPIFDQAVLQPSDSKDQRALRSLSKTLVLLSASLRQFALRMGRPFTPEELEG